MLKLLLDRGANPHHSPCGNPDRRPLNRAIAVNNERWVLMMLGDQRLDSDPRAKGGCYLHQAFRLRDVVISSHKLFDKLLSLGADVAEIDQDGNYPVSVLLQALIDRPFHVSDFHRYIYILLRRGAKAGVDVHKPNKEGLSIVALLQTLLDIKQAKSYIGARLAIVDADDGRKEIEFLEVPMTTKGWKLLKALQYGEPDSL
jgi:hypothetical protein